MGSGHKSLPGVPIHILGGASLPKLLPAYLALLLWLFCGCFNGAAGVQTVCCPILNNTAGALVEYPWDAQCSCLARALELDLHGMGITALPDSWGDPKAFPRLQLLNVSYNNITTLPRSWGQSGGFPKLEAADFYSNLIGGLSGTWAQVGAFPLLKYLGLSANRIGTLPESWGQVQAFSNLEILGLSGNRLTGPLPDTWAQEGAFPSLQYLSLGYNRLSSLPESWGNSTAFPFLVELYLPYNRLTGALPNAWCEPGAFQSLEVLHLAANGLDSVPSIRRGALPSLRELVLESNLLRAVPDFEPGALSNLETLDLSVNDYLANPPETWGGPGSFPNLDHFYLYSNPSVTKLPDSWGLPGAFPKLEHLDIQSLTGLASLPDAWGQPGGFPKLGTIYCFSCNLTALPDQWGGPSSFPSLVFFDASYNHITEVPLSWSRPEGQLSRGLRYLNVAANPLRAPPRLGAACYDNIGCAIVLYGTPQVHHLPSSYLKEVCLHKASVLLELIPPGQLLPLNGSALTLSNADGRVFLLTDPDVLQNMLPYFLSPSYTGVEFLPPPQDRCRDETAPLIITITWAAFLAVCCGVLLTMRIFRGCFPHNVEGGTREPGILSFLIFVVGMPWAAVQMASVATDIVLLIAVWGVWPMWFIMGFLLPPYLASAWLLAPNILRTLTGGINTRCGESNKVGVTFDWRLTIGTSHADWVTSLPPKRPPSFKEQLFVLLLLPFSFLAVIVLDLITIISRVGVHFRMGGGVLALADYHSNRSFLQAVLSTVVQAVFQSVLYARGTSRESRIYVDRATFLASIGTSLASLLQLTCTMYYEKHVNGLSLVALLQWKLGNSAVKVHGASKLSDVDGGDGDVSGGDTGVRERRAPEFWDTQPFSIRGESVTDDVQLRSPHRPRTSGPRSGQDEEGGSAPSIRIHFKEAPALRDWIELPKI